MGNVHWKGWMACQASACDLVVTVLLPLTPALLAVLAACSSYHHRPAWLQLWWKCWAMPQLCAASLPQVLRGTCTQGWSLANPGPCRGQNESQELAGSRRLSLTFQQTHHSQGMHGKVLHRFWHSYLLRTVANIYLQILTLGCSAQP